MGRRVVAMTVAALLVGVTVGFAIGSSGGDGSSDVAAAPSASPSSVHLVKVGGVLLPERDDQLTPELEPYPYTTPGPATGGDAYRRDVRADHVDG
jgi:hypothetical protein